jgi:hypothetical protein
MVKLKAACDFGLDQATADAIALGFDPRVRNVGHLIDALASALIERTALQLLD